MNEMYFIRPVKKDSVSFYILSLFYNRNDALQYLVYAKENGFKDAYIVNQYEINTSADSLYKNETISGEKAAEKIYTIQLKASKVQLSMNLFKGVEGVSEIFSDDGYYRYVHGNFTSFSKAKTELIRMQDSGFTNAFIRDLNSITEK
jgi:hypothetical protein